MAKSAKKSNVTNIKAAPTKRAVTMPFFKALHEARERAYLLEVVLAREAGVTVSEYRAIELGRVPLTCEVYDAAVARFSTLKAFPRPLPMPTPLTPSVHPAVVFEQERVKDFFESFTQLNVGKSNKALIRQMLLMAAEGVASPRDIDHFFPAG